MSHLTVSNSSTPLKPSQSSMIGSSFNTLAPNIEMKASKSDISINKKKDRHKSEGRKKKDIKKERRRSDRPNKMNDIKEVAEEVEIENELEEDTKGHEIDKSLWPYRRCSIYKARNQKEALLRKRKGTDKWTTNWFVLYCNYLLWYKPGNNKSPPLFNEIPIGQLKLELIDETSIEDYKDQIKLSGLIPKIEHYENCIQLMAADKLFLLRFDTSDEKKDWEEALKLTIRKCKNARLKLVADPINFIESLMNQISKNHNLQKYPLPGEELRWIQQMKYYFQMREKYLEDVENVMYFGEYYLPTNKNFIDWFALPGGDTNGIQSLEKELLAAEDSVTSKWKEQFMNTQEAEKILNDPQTDEITATKWRQKSHSIAMLVDFYHTYYKEIYGLQPAYETFKMKWTQLEKEFEKLVQRKLNQKEEERKKAIEQLELQRKQQIEEQKRKEEEKRRMKEDPFYIGKDPEDDPFAGVVIKSVKF